MVVVVGEFFGVFNKCLLKEGEFCYGINGLLSVDFKVGMWFDYEMKEGGGVIVLIKC